MKLRVHADHREDLPRLREALVRDLGQGAPRAELWASHRQLDDGPLAHEVRLTLHAPRLRGLHVVGRGHELESAAREAVLQLGHALAREATRAHRTVVSRDGHGRVDRRGWWTFKPGHGPV